MGDTKYTYTLDGKAAETSDPVMPGRDTRSKAGIVPASDHLIIEMRKLSSRSLGLDEELVLWRRSFLATGCSIAFLKREA